MNLRLTNINKSYNDLEVLRNFSIDFIPGSINCVLGPSGCGKTTLLNIISGLTEWEGSNDFKGKDTSYIFQEDRLLPWKTVKENIRFILQSKYNGQELEEVISKYVDLIELENFSSYYPHQLSGGMKRRVSIARAFSYPSEVVLLDEPFKGIDISLKLSLMSSIRKIWDIERRTLIYVTHDIDESILMGHRIYVFTGRPARVINHYDFPDNPGPQRDFSSQDYILKEKIRKLMMKEAGSQE